MSFWPFGQNVNSSNINKLLDDYFSVLHQVESITATNPQSLNITKNSSNTENSNSVRKSHGSKKKRTNIDSEEDENDEEEEEEEEEEENDDDEEDEDEDKEGNEDNDNNEHIHVSPQDIKFVSNGISINGSSSISNRSNKSNKSNHSGKQTQIHNDDQQNNFEIFQNLNSSFIDQILEESELLNELTRKNNTLLDFICFGYFYDSELNKILNLEYLINLLMFSIKGVNNKRNTNSLSNGNNITNETASKTFPLDIENGKRNNNYDKNNDNDNNDDDDNSNKNKNNNNINNDDNDDINNEQNTDTEEDRYLQKATIISEVFALDIWLISESLVKNPVYLSNIWSILENPNFNSPKSPLVPIFLKINTNLLVTRQDQYLNFIRTLSLNASTEHLETSCLPNGKDTSPVQFHNHILVDDMLKHVDCPVLMDFFLKIISTDKIDNPTGVLELVHEQGLIKKLMDFFQNDLYPTDLQSSSCDFLKALIAISANAPLDELTIGPNILTRQLCTDPEILNLFIHIITKEKGYALNMAVSIVIELIRKNNSDYDQVNLLTTTIKLNPPNQRDPIYLGYMLKVFAENLSDIVAILSTDHSMLKNPPQEYENDSADTNTKPVYINQMGEVYKPLGFEKFKVVELIAELLHCSNMGLMNSRKAEYMATKRNSLRYNLSKQLEDALKDLDLSANGDSDEDLVTDTHTSVSGNLTATITASSSPSSDLAPSFDSTKPLSPQMSTSHDDIQSSQSNQQLDDLQQYDFYDQEEEDIMKIEEIEEIFDIPYVNANQNEKLRNRPTIGDFFKIQLFDLQILPRIVKMFLQYPWNNFWHNVIFDILQQVFNGRMDYSYNSFLVYALFANSQIGQYTASSGEQVDEETSAIRKNSEQSNERVVMDFDLPRDLILNGYEDSGEFYQKHNINLGYMGHLVLIAEEIVKFSKVYKVDLISEDIHESLTNPKWIYYADDILMDTRLMYSKILGGDMIATNGSSEEDLLIEQRLQEQQELAHQAAAAAAAAAKHNEDGGLSKAGDSDSENDSESDEALVGSLLSQKGEEEFIHYTTQDDLHKKLREKLIEKSEEEVNKRNMENGVIVLGYSPAQTTDTAISMPEEHL